MNVKELSKEQMSELKERYLTQLADEGTFAEVLGVDYDEPSHWDLIHADEIVPNDVIYEHYSGVDFVEDDFFCGDKTADELAYDRYCNGDYTWNDYVDVCALEDVPPCNWEEHARGVLDELGASDNDKELFIEHCWNNLEHDEDNVRYYKELNGDVN